MANQHIVQRHWGLARAALAGEAIRDSGGDDVDEGRSGAAGVDDLLVGHRLSG
jgi:hypothetical protein